MEKNSRQKNTATATNFQPRFTYQEPPNLAEALKQQLVLKEQEQLSVQKRLEMQAIGYKAKTEALVERLVGAATAINVVAPTLVNVTANPNDALKQLVDVTLETGRSNVLYEENVTINDHGNSDG